MSHLMDYIHNPQVEHQNDIRCLHTWSSHGVHRWSFVLISYMNLPQFTDFLTKCGWWVCSALNSLKEIACCHPTTMRLHLHPRTLSLSAILHFDLRREIGPESKMANNHRTNCLTHRFEGNHFYKMRLVDFLCPDAPLKRNCSHPTTTRMCTIKEKSLNLRNSAVSK